MDLPYYYVTKINPYKIEETDLIDELVTLLWSGDAEFISNAQIIEQKLPETYNDDLRKIISQYEERIPLYDITFNHIYLIFKDNVYPRIYQDNYRFVDKKFYDNLLEMDNPSETDSDNIRILSHYDLDELQKTYMMIFYKSFLLTSYITNCRRPSYASHMDHIAPYYTINELYYLAYDWNLTSKPTLSEAEIENFCKQISAYDIPAETLLSHQMHIYNSRGIGLVKYYSLFGSYYMNLYLRKNRCTLREHNNYEDFIRNPDLENQIKIMIKLIKNAPAFIKAHTVYRFIQRDDFMKHLKLGDIYTDCSFMSTTRNPFYYKENYDFGYILIKIKLPANIKGVGLCIESYSNFPNEEEIILPPTSKYRLMNFIENKENVEFQGIFDLKVQKKYEFEWIGNDYIDSSNTDIFLDMPGSYNPEIQKIDMAKLMDDENLKDLTISDRLKYFRDTYLNFNNQFISILNNTPYIFTMQSYDSTFVYKPFFYYEVPDGIMVTTSNPKYGNINIIMEIGPEIHINYYFRFSITDSSITVDINRIEWVEWFSMFAYIVGSRNIVIHSNYELHYDPSATIEEKQIQTRYTYSQNIYLYLKHGKKMFEFEEIIPNFDYSQLDYLFNYPISDIIKPSDHGELYILSQKSKKNNMGDFYLYIVENFPKLIKPLEEKMELIFDPDINPFLNISYSLDAWLYLYNKKLIKQIPLEKEFAIKKGSFKKLIGDKKIKKFKNRLRTYLLRK